MLGRLPCDLVDVPPPARFGFFVDVTVDSEGSSTEKGCLKKAADKTADGTVLDFLTEVAWTIKNCQKKSQICCGIRSAALRTLVHNEFKRKFAWICYLPVCLLVEA